MQLGCLNLNKMGSLAYHTLTLESVKAMNTIKPGDVIEVLTDNDESALKSIPSVCDKRRWEFLVLQEAEELWRVRIKKPITA